MEQDIEYSGDYLNDQPNDKDYGRVGGRRASVQECQQLCQLRKRCTVFTYKHISRQCWLKARATGRKFQTGAISGKQRCTRNI